MIAPLILLLLFINAHQILFDLYGNKRDLGAVYMLSGRREEAELLWQQAGALATNELMRERGATVYDQEWQREMARRSMARPDARQIRSAGGVIGGRNTNIGRAINTSHRYLFKRSVDTGGPAQDFLCIFNCETGGDVVRELNKAVPTNLTRATPLLRGSRDLAYGWSCIRLPDAPETDRGTGEALSS